LQVQAVALPVDGRVPSGNTGVIAHMLVLGHRAADKAPSIVLLLTVLGLSA
jgi:hypothetical protein